MYQCQIAGRNNEVLHGVLCCKCKLLEKRCVDFEAGGLMTRE